MTVARSGLWSRVLGVLCGITVGLIQTEASPAWAKVNKGPPVNVEVSSLDELKQALGKATPGSVIRLAAGVYQIYADDPLLSIQRVAGLPDQPIVVEGSVTGEPGRHDTIIDGGRSLDPMLGLVEHYRRAGSRPVELDEILIRTRFRTERALNCFVLENVEYLVIQNLTVRNCWPISFVIYNKSRYVTIRSTRLIGATYPIFAARYSDHILVEDNVWTQDASGYNEDQSGYSGRVDLTPRPGRMWDTIPWGVVHHGSRAYLNGGLVGGFRTAGNIVIRHNIIRNAYNGVRIRANRCPHGETCSVNVEIYDNDLQFIRDNPIEPEDRAVNWWIYHNRVYNGHGWFSLDGVHGGPIYIFGNVGWFDDKPAQHCIQRNWAADQVIHPGKRYEPTPEGECTRSRTGKVIKLGSEPVEMAQPVYIFNNSWFVRAPIFAGGRSRLRFWNNAIEFCDPATIPTSRCIADFENDATCVQSPAGAVNPFANPFPIGLDEVPFYDCFAPSPGDEFTFTLTNYPGFPDRLEQDGRPFYGWRASPGFVNGPAGDFKLRPDSLAKGKGCVVTRGPGDTLICVPAPDGAGPAIGAYQGNSLSVGPDFINHRDERPRLVRVDWRETADGVRVEMAFSAPIQDPPSDATAALRSANDTTLPSEPCRKSRLTMLQCQFRLVKAPPSATETLLIPRSIKSEGGMSVTLWAANASRVQFQPAAPQADRGQINQATVHLQ